MSGGHGQKILILFSGAGQEQFRKSLKMGWRLGLWNLYQDDKNLQNRLINIFIQLIWKTFLGYVNKRYVVPNERLRSYMDVFDIPKESNVCIVQNGTSCGLNVCVGGCQIFGFPLPKLQVEVCALTIVWLIRTKGNCFWTFPCPRLPICPCYQPEAV